MAVPVNTVHICTADYEYTLMSNRNMYILPAKFTRTDVLTIIITSITTVRILPVAKFAKPTVLGFVPSN